MSNPLPIPKAIKSTLLRCVATEEYEFGQHSDLDDLRQWVKDLERAWPDMPDLQGGVDRFSEHPVSGECHQ